MKFGITNQGFKRLAQDLLEESEEILEEVEISSIRDLQDYLVNKYGIELYLGETGGGMVLHKIVVPEEERGGGIGSQVMEEIVQYADANGLAIGTTPDTAFGGTMGRLKEFYKSFGFVPNKGRNKDYAFMETYIRPL